MSSGDRERQQNALDYETSFAQNNLNNLREGMVVPSAQRAFNWADVGANQAFQSYGDIMGRYQGLADESANLPAHTIDPTFASYQRTPEMGQALSGYGEFANTGGFSPEGIRDIRARGISPIRAAYGNTMRQLNQAKGLGGDTGATNYVAAVSRANRELPQQLSDATQAVNADLARMVQQGRLSGLAGLSSTAQADTGFGQQVNLANQDASMRASLANQSAKQLADQSRLGGKATALSGMSSLYSATPGQASVFGNQANEALQAWLNTQGLQQSLAGTKIQGQLANAGIPTGFQAFLGNTQKIGDIVSDAASIF